MRYTTSQSSNLDTALVQNCSHSRLRRALGGNVGSQRVRRQYQQPETAAPAALGSEAKFYIGVAGFFSTTLLGHFLFQVANFG